jgi:hypothetical protein
VDIVENAVEDNQQFLVKVNLPFLINRIDIDRHLVLDDRFGMAYRPCPVDFVETGVDILEYERDIRLVVLVELDK